MRPISVLLSIFLLVGLIGSPAFAASEDDPKRRSYVEMQAGYSYVPHQTLANGPTQSRVESTIDDGFHVGFAIGRRLGDQFRLEGAVSYRNADVDVAGVVATAPADGKQTLIAGMLNGYVDFDFGIPVIPYAGFGVGFGEFKIDLSQETSGALEIDDGDIVFIYNAMAGITIELTRTSELNFGYRYIAIPNNDSTALVNGSTAQTIRSEYDAHEAVAGLRFNF